MDKVSRSLLVFGVYFIGLGLVLMLYPEILILFGVSPESPWIRVVGLAVSVIGVFYMAAGKHQYIEFAKYSLFTRTAQLFFFSFMVYTDLLPMVMMLFALIEFLFGVWTYVEIRRLNTT